jgi:hypothetical protein
MIPCFPDLSSMGLFMAKRTINVKEILADIKAEMNNAALME